MKFLKNILILIKIRVVVFSSLSALTGYILVSKTFSIDLLFFMGGIFLLASGSAALNQFQEYQWDGLMKRTRLRPIPSGQLTPKTALCISTVLIFTGLFILSIYFGFYPFLLGIATVMLYNGLYTPLKRMTAFAAVPGALVGALPPAIGWIAGGGNFPSPILIGIMIFFFLWQVPHFWLLLGFNANDYRQAGLPSLNQHFSSLQIRRITFIWVLASACAGLLFPLFNKLNHQLLLLFLVITTLWLGINSLPLLKKNIVSQTESIFQKTFRDINIFVFLFMVILIIDSGV